MKNIGDTREPLAFSEVDGVYPKTYEELCVFLSDKGRAQQIRSGDGKIYDSDIGKAVWANVVVRKKPVKGYEGAVAESIYQLIGELGFNGDFPAMLYLYDRFDLSENEYNNICRDRDDDRSAIFRWAREVFSHASKINAVHGNGNVSVFQYVNMPDEVEQGGESDYVTPPRDIGNILALFGELSKNQGRVGHADETDV